MKTTHSVTGPTSLVVAVMLGLASSAWSADTITDRVGGYEGVLQGATTFVPSTRPGATGGDYALDLTPAGGGVAVTNVNFLNAAAANDTISFSFWVKKYDMADSSAFWVRSPSQDRAIQAHTPWSNDNIYFDTAGCCDGATQRINAAMTGFTGYTGPSWWDDWHHFVFFKNGSNKEVWIDGQFFFGGENTAPLPTDINYLFIGGAVPGSTLMHGQMDDFAIFSNALSPEDIASLFNGTAPDALGGANQLLAYWDFDASILADPLGFTVNVKDVGTSPMVPSTVVLTLDGEVVTPTSANKTDNVTVIQYLLPSPPFLPESTHSVHVAIEDGEGTAFSYDYSFTIGTFGMLTSDMALPAGSVDTNLRGFKIRTYQVDGVSPGNGVQVAEDILAGVHGPNVAYLDDIGGVDVRGYFTYPDLINLSTLEDPNATFGRFTAPDYIENPFPGIPGDTLSYANFASEFYTALEFTAPGLYTMVVNSDDCFATSSGPNPLDTISAAQLGRFDAPGGRGAADTSFQFYVESAGIYGFRTVYQQGTGAGNIEWFMVNADGTRVLLNDTTNAIPAYQWLPTPTGAYISALVPADRSTAAAPGAITATIVDGPTPVSTDSVSLSLDGATVPATVTKTGGEILVSYVPDPMLASGSTHTATVAYTDDGEPVSRSWTFTIAQYTLDVVGNHAGLLRGTTTFAAAGDRPHATPENMAIDSTGGGVFVDDASFLNQATANDSMAFAFWVKKYDMAASSAFWALSPTSPSTSRGFQAHVPWSDNNIYFDTAGCCDAGVTRISASTTTFPGYTGPEWWDSWHHFVFQKNGVEKQVWIDGELFLAGDGSAPLPMDMTSLWIGNAADNNIMHGQIDDFAVYIDALAPENIQALASGTAPDALAGAPTLLAYWTFEDAPAAGQPTISLNTEGAIVFTGVLQETDAVTGAWTDVPAATSPYTMPKTGAMMLYRSRN